MSGQHQEIRPGHLADVDRLLEVDRAATDLFDLYDFEGFLDMPASPEDDRAGLEDAIRCGWLQVLTENSAIAGYIETRPCDGGLYIAELSVDPVYGRRGLGRKLLGVILEQARAAGHSFACLTTFDHVAWNRPFYEKLGFSVCAPEDVGPELKAIFERQAAYLDRTLRVAMRLSLR